MKLQTSDCPDDVARALLKDFAAAIVADHGAGVRPDRRARRPGDGQRLAGLDFWRATLLLMGVVMHGFGSVNLRPDAPMFMIPSSFTGLFRMEAFFVIAGFFSCGGLAGDRAAWLRRRVRQLGVPLAFGVTVINVAMIGLIAATSGQAMPPVGLRYVEHLWFLINLLIYAAAMAGARGFADRAASLAERYGVGRLAAALTVGNMLFALGVGAMLYFTPMPELGRVMVKSVILYAPFYLAGYAIGRSSVLRGRLVSARLPLMLIAAPLLIGATAWDVTHASTDPAAKAVAAALKAGVGPIAALAIIAHGLTLRLTGRRMGAFARRWAEASYTIYVVHMLALTAVWSGLKLAGIADPNMLIAIPILLAIPACHAFHHGIVARSVSLSLLINGNRRVAIARGAATKPKVVFPAV